MVTASREDEPLPQRTRAHVIADLSVNFVQRLILEEGHTASREFVDYGYDLTIRTFNDQGFMEPGFLFVQVKATDHIGTYDQPERDRFAFPVEARHARLWGRETAPRRTACGGLQYG